MSQNKTIVPGVNIGNNRDADTETFYESLYSRTANNDKRTVICGEDQPTPSLAEATPRNTPSNATLIETERKIRIKDRVMVGVLYSISRTLLGELYPIYLGRNTLGQGSHCDIILPERTVSTEHAIIQTRNDANATMMTITDTGSRYGTTVNGNDARYTTLALNDDDTITIGQHYRFVVKIFDAERHNLYEDANFADTTKVEPAALQQYPSAIEDDFYNSSENGSNSSRTVLY